MSSETELPHYEDFVKVPVAKEMLVSELQARWKQEDDEIQRETDARAHMLAQQRDAQITLITQQYEAKLRWLRAQQDAKRLEYEYDRWTALHSYGQEYKSASGWQSWFQSFFRRT